jgi:hypothetical protein
VRAVAGRARGARGERDVRGGGVVRTVRAARVVLAISGWCPGRVTVGRGTRLAAS